MTRHPVSAGAALPSSPPPLALVPPGQRSNPAAGVGIASPASAGSLDESTPDDLRLDAGWREMAKS